MAVSDDRKYTKAFVHTLLEGIKTLGEVDKSHQFARTEKSEKITGIAGDVIEQSVFGYERDSKQECDINHMASLLCDQTSFSQSYRQTSGLTAGNLLPLRDYTRVRCLGRSLVLQASAPS